MANLQFPYPRKSSVPTVSTSPRRSTYLRQRRAIRTYGPPLIGLTAIIWLLFYLFSTRPTTASTTLAIPPRPSNPPEVIIVTPLDPSLPQSFTSTIRANRNHYARLHNYATLFPSTHAYDLLPNTPNSWSLVPSLRHAQTLHPHTPWIWHLSSTALIMNTTLSLDSRLLSPSVLPSLLLPDTPVVPPDSVIHTPSHRNPASTSIILSRDATGLAHDSFLIRNSEWAKFFLDAWFDPLYRSYNFQKAERHALEHIVQWHGTILGKVGLVQQRVLNGYVKQEEKGGEEAMYREGDFVANFWGCGKEEGRASCEKEMGPMMEKWRGMRDAEGRS
ncbi:unnamed protein product [Zymoseptoria tritici ST99CH_3D1]|nr:unnamed protein product [Zymoseptoria tritici ST99CH_3D1]